MTDDIVERLRDLLTAAMLPARRAVIEQAADEIEWLRAALQEICDYHIPSQPETYDGDSLSWAYRQHAHLRRIAQRALP